jgi:hypothetical protein
MKREDDFLSLFVFRGKDGEIKGAATPPFFISRKFLSLLG